MHTPNSVQDLCDLFRAGGTFEIRGGGSKAEIGAPREAQLVSTAGLAGVIDYDPAELVLTVGAGTPLAEIQALVASENQMLAFDPFDHGPLFGRPAGAATIGGVIAAGVSGSQRLALGAARDHLLGFEAVSGRGERFIGGARVVKNVTGYDLPKVMAGSWGRLGVMTQLTLKILPAPRVRATMLVEGLDVAAAVAAMTAALRAPLEVAAAAHLPGIGTGLRLQGFGPSVDARAAQLPGHRLSETEGDAFWQAALPPADDRPLWRVHCQPSAALAIVAALPDLETRLDWGGGLIWLAGEGDVRAVAAMYGGQAMLVRAPEAMRAAIPCEHPQPAGVAALSVRVRRAFDPAGIFETGRF
ncbi:glycolate oxidase FAD binding subunit [Caulobacter ginsengisoli]|uniref:Glycolate oxidase FAD binding subunit n=1 Tax=Caulobacter ginsengisoli TaxID=400775 RepID=A0ABU0IU87_9CAUL|nr:FAD-binding protein [Caulobacter ginsengisoli]MDQ0464970.1 glycolate oxidase FAD binding subunit [Caulobacter ginsengisoli]